MMQHLFTQTLDSPIGLLQIVCSHTALAAIHFSEHQVTAGPGESELLSEVIRQLQQYFSGERTEFDLPLNPQGTPFQKTVWQALQTVPFGKTASYKAIAEAIGNPKAVRAVGLANARNPIPIVIPCHRIIGSNGKLTGYAGGLWRKEYLLNLEKTDYKR
jgi:methylated-DNA-[protein]-cysteine S-methyltransferase